MTYMTPFSRGPKRTPNMLDSFFSDMWSPVWDFSGDTFRMDVKDNEKEYVIEADLPGVNKDEVNLQMRDNTLSIEVKREEQNEETKENYVHKERRFSSMSRKVYLRDVKSDDIDAKLENGVLTVKIAKIDESQLVKQIDIK